MKSYYFVWNWDKLKSDWKGCSVQVLKMGKRRAVECKSTRVKYYIVWLQSIQRSSTKGWYWNWLTIGNYVYLAAITREYISILQRRCIEVYGEYMQHKGSIRKIRIHCNLLVELNLNRNLFYFTRIFSSFFFVRNFLFQQWLAADDNNFNYFYKQPFLFIRKSYYYYYELHAKQYNKWKTRLI